MGDIIKGIKEFYDKSVYVWRASKKPTKQDLNENLKIVLIGMFILGLIGFLVAIIFSLLQA
jgi:protein translocase SEC61 complex gamma subunit